MAWLSQNSKWNECGSRLAGGVPGQTSGYNVQVAYEKKSHSWRIQGHSDNSAKYAYLWLNNSGTQEI